MNKFTLLFLLVSPYFIFKFASAIHCQQRVRFVQERNIFLETLDTQVGITNGEPFLEQYLNQSRFVRQETENCVDACTR